MAEPFFSNKSDSTPKTHLKSHMLAQRSNWATHLPGRSFGWQNKNVYCLGPNPAAGEVVYTSKLGHFFENSWFYFPKRVTKKSEDAQGPIWRYLVMKWVSNISKKHENRLPPCHVRPNPAKVRGNRIVWSMPCPWTPPDLPKYHFKLSKKQFLWKRRFSVFLQFFAQ